MNLVCLSNTSSWLINSLRSSLTSQLQLLGPLLPPPPLWRSSPALVLLPSPSMPVSTCRRWGGYSLGSERWVGMLAEGMTKETATGQGRGWDGAGGEEEAGRGGSGQSYGFSSSHVRMWELDTKKAEHRRIDAFKLFCWRRLLRIPWTKRSNQWILKEINPEYSLEGLMLKLKLQYFIYLLLRASSLAKTVMLGKTESRRRRGQTGLGLGLGLRQLDGITDSMNMSLIEFQEIVNNREAWRAAIHGVTKS